MFSAARVVGRRAIGAAGRAGHTAAHRPQEGKGPVHFRLTPGHHPLGSEKKRCPSTWENPTQNHVWSQEELEALLAKEKADAVHFKPDGAMDRMTYWAVRGCYHAFNFITGFNSRDPTPKSLIYRVLILESIAGCPGMVAAGIRHFNSLRRMERDGGWIHTLLEEAENERMHLLVFMNMFTPGRLTRWTVVGCQYVLVAFLTSLYMVRPQLVHRFVGYLEETAVQTYLNIISHMETPGSKVYKEWHGTPAPEIAIDYWRLPADASFLDVVKQICADEMHHRDVNHEFASMHQKDFNPFVTSHLKDMDEAAAARAKAAARAAEVDKAVAAHKASSA
eukprot:TRINITY_DN230_c1_g1_i1.p1 TRINITY_DN230_c1_g1~~TRINITY_DN230_c1_g1_i1.p1  ORF type:complete len:335 (+),score=135.36 TRINITY_DN230_c1_g1_i1:68-1072(+)